MQQDADEFVLEVLEGCAPSASREASRLGECRLVSPTELRLFGADLADVRSLRCAVAAYAVLSVPARRPRELLETSFQQRIAQLWERVRTQRPRMRFTGVRLAAAGADTPDMRRLAQSLAETTGLGESEEGDLLVRVRRSGDGEGWELLMRTTSRPLATRAWRTVDYPGAVNATIAASVLDLLGVGAEDAVLDMTCGSGTFLIEQLHRAAPRRAVGVDVSEAAIEAAQAHQRAARRRGRIDWITGDVLTAPLEGGFTRILTNPPWGMLHGEHATNEQLHEDLLARAAQLAAPGARMGVLTQEVRRMRAVLERESCPWRVHGEHMFFQKGHRPRLFVLERG